MTAPDPTEEIKEIRHRLGAELNYDLDLIVAGIQKRQKESGLNYVTLLPRKIVDNNELCVAPPIENIHSGSSIPAIGPCK